MRLIHLLFGIILFTIFVIFWFVCVGVFQYSAVRAGYKEFYQLMDSLFSEFKSEEYDEIEDVFKAKTDYYVEDINNQK